MTTNIKPEQNIPQSLPPLRRVTAGIKRWSRRTLSPWIQSRLGSKPAQESQVESQPAGFTQTALSGQHIQKLLTRVHRRTAVGPRQRQYGQLPTAAGARLAGAIVGRRQAIRPAIARHRVSAAPAVPKDKLVLAGGLQPAQPPPPATTPEGFSINQIIPPMAAPQRDFGAGQPLPVPPAPSGSGFSVGQRIPPMPKPKQSKQPPPSPKPRSSTKSKPVEAPKSAQRRVYSRVEEVSPDEMQTRSASPAGPATEVPVQRAITPPDPRKPETHRPSGPQAAPVDKKEQPPGPDAAGAPDALPQPGATEQPPETAATETPVQRTITPPDQRKPDTSRPSHPSGPQAASVGKKEQSPGPKTADAALTGLKQTIQQRATARTRLPLHRRQPATGPNPIGRSTGTNLPGRNIRRLARFERKQETAIPQPVAGRPVHRQPTPRVPPQRDPAGIRFARQQPAGPASTLPPHPSSGMDESSNPHLAALRAIEQKFGAAAVASPQERLGGLAELGQPKSKTPAQEPQPGADRPARQPFDINNISLGRPKIKVARRQPGQKEAGSKKAMRSTPAARISQSRSQLVLARKGSKGGGKSGRGGATTETPPPTQKPRDRVIRPDVSRLALAVYPLVKRLLAMERERRPGY